jgi:hypothetical protein
MTIRRLELHRSVLPSFLKKLVPKSYKQSKSDASHSHTTNNLISWQFCVYPVDSRFYCADLIRLTIFSESHGNILDRGCLSDDNGSTACGCTSEHASCCIDSGLADTLQH